MSYKTAFASNNADLQTILDKVNSLPDKAKGCKVHVKTLMENGPYSYATVTIGGTTYYASTDKNPNTIVEVESGTEITLLVKGTASIASKSYIAIDGEKVVSSAGMMGVSYAYTVTKDITVELNAGVATYTYGFINVVTGKVDGDPDISFVPETQSTFVPTDSGGTTYKSKFADNNVDLRAMLAKIEGL